MQDAWQSVLLEKGLLFFHWYKTIAIHQNLLLHWMQQKRPLWVQCQFNSKQRTPLYTTNEHILTSTAWTFLSITPFGSFLYGTKLSAQMYSFEVVHELLFLNKLYFQSVHSTYSYTNFKGPLWNTIFGVHAPVDLVDNFYYELAMDTIGRLFEIEVF